MMFLKFSIAIFSYLSLPDGINHDISLSKSDIPSGVIKRGWKIRSWGDSTFATFDGGHMRKYRF
jgi:hypothetical protein